MYFCAGYGYVVSTTFIVAIASNSVTLQMVGHWAFLLLGLAAAPSAIWWDQIARRLGYLPSLRLAAFINAVAIVLPVLVPGAWAFMISAMLFGASFIGCVSLVLTVAGRLMPEKPARLMAILTLCYGSAQIIAPSISALLADAAGSYDTSLMVAGLMMVFAGALLSFLISMFDAAHWLRRH
jgi:MFS family permease